MLRRVRALGGAAAVTLGNHDLHLLALAHGFGRQKRDDTLSEILAAPDRDSLLDWLARLPLCVEDRALNLCMLHAGLSPQWDMPTARRCAREFERALRREPSTLFENMYGDQPDRWDEALKGAERLRYIVNCFTRLRYVDAEGRLELHAKGAPKKAQRGSLIPWYEAPQARWRGTRLVVGHWSTLGFFRNADVTALDTGCVWGGRLDRTSAGRAGCGAGAGGLQLVPPRSRGVKRGRRRAAARSRGSRPRYNGRMHIFPPFDLRAWIDQNRDLLKPPVGNKLLFEDGEFIVMAVGGPNSRKDFHHDPGPEFFFQIEGDMVLEDHSVGPDRSMYPSAPARSFCCPPRLRIHLSGPREASASSWSGGADRMSWTASRGIARTAAIACIWSAWRSTTS